MNSERQRQANRAHHESRVAWLSAESPRWACGTPVAKHEAREMLTKSHESLEHINKYGMNPNHADAICERVLSDGEPCGLRPPCPDCGRACHDVPVGS